MNKLLANRRLSLLLLLVLTTLFDFSLVAYRLIFIGYDLSLLSDPVAMYRHRAIPTFLFLVWNLLLAWLPLCFALLLRLSARRRWPILAAVGVLSLWLLFFPNAPYIVTDLLHLRERPPVPLWYDVLMIFSFAWTGLILGFWSLIEVHQYVERRMGSAVAWPFVSLALVLGGIGVYLGRFQRWNSWDLFTNPFHLFADIARALWHPTAHLSTFGLAFVMAGLLVLGYATLVLLGRIASD